MGKSHEVLAAVVNPSLDGVGDDAYLGYFCGCFQYFGCDLVYFLGFLFFPETYSVPFSLK